MVISSMSPMFTLSADDSVIATRNDTNEERCTWMTTRNDTNGGPCTWMTLEDVYLRNQVPHAQPYHKKPLEIIMATAHGVSYLANAKPISYMLSSGNITICRIRCGQQITIVKRRIRFIDCKHVQRIFYAPLYRFASLRTISVCSKLFVVPG